MRSNQSNNGKIYNLAICDEGQKVKMFLQLDIDGDGDMDNVTTFHKKKLGGDVEAECIEKLRKFFDVFGFPRVLIILGTLDIMSERWISGFPEIKRVDIMPVEKTNKIEPVETWFLTINAVNENLFLLLRDDSKILDRYRTNLPVPSIVNVIKKFLSNFFSKYGQLPGKIINECPERFSFEEFKEFLFFEDFELDVIVVDKKEHLLIQENGK